MKKIISFILIIISSISVVSAKSINDLYNELNSLETKKNLYNYLTSDEINNILSASLDMEIRRGRNGPDSSLWSKQPRNPW